MITLTTKGTKSREEAIRKKRVAAGKVSGRKRRNRVRARNSMIVLCYRFLSNKRQSKEKNESAKAFLIKKTGCDELVELYGESAISKIAKATKLSWKSVNRILIEKKAKIVKKK